MAPPLSTAIPDARRTRESSNESSGVPLDSNLCTKPAPGSAKNTLPSESAAKATGVWSFPGPSPLSPQAPRNSNGGGCCGMRAGSVRFAHEMANVAASRMVKTSGNRRREKEDLAMCEKISFRIRLTLSRRILSRACPPAIRLVRKELWHSRFHELQAQHRRRFCSEAFVRPINEKVERVCEASKLRRANSARRILRSICN